MRGTQSFGVLAANMVGEAGVRVAVGLAAVFALGRADVAMAAYLVGIVAVWPHLRGWLRRHGSDSQLESSLGPSTARFWSFVWPLLVLAVADAGFQNYDVLYVKRVFPDGDAGAYGAAATLSRGLGVAVTPFVIQVVPLLADHSARKRSTSGAMARLVGAFVFLSVGAMLFFAAAGDLLVETLFGRDFDAAADVLVPHALGSLAGYLAMVLAQGLAALARFWFIGAYVAAFVVEILLLHMFGDTPVAVAVCALVVKFGVLGLTAIAWMTRNRGSGAPA